MVFIVNISIAMNTVTIFLKQAFKKRKNHSRSFSKGPQWKKKKKKKQTFCVISAIAPHDCFLFTKNFRFCLFTYLRVKYSNYILQISNMLFL